MCWAVVLEVLQLDTNSCTQTPSGSGDVKHSWVSKWPYEPLTLARFEYSLLWSGPNSFAHPEGPDCFFLLGLPFKIISQLLLVPLSKVGGHATSTINLQPVLSPHNFENILWDSQPWSNEVSLSKFSEDVSVLWSNLPPEKVQGLYYLCLDAAWHNKSVWFPFCARVLHLSAFFLLLSLLRMKVATFDINLQESRTLQVLSLSSGKILACQ